MKTRWPSNSNWGSGSEDMGLDANSLDSSTKVTEPQTSEMTCGQQG